MSSETRQANTNLRSERERRGWSQSYLADALGISQAQLSRIESGEQEPQKGTVYLLSVLFGVRQGEIERWCGIETKAA